MKFYKYAIAAVSAFISFHSSAQQIQTDRPNETESPSVISPGHLQVEGGFKYEKEDTEETVYCPETVLRLGIIKNAELRFETAFQTLKDDESTLYGIQPSALGIKYHILDHKKLQPDLAVLARVTIPWLADNAFQEEKYSPEVRLLAQHELSKKAHIGYNAGLSWMSPDLKTEYIYALSFDHTLTKKIKIVIESYGTVESHHHAKNTADASVLFLLTNRVQLDITAGSSLMHAENKKFAGAGISVSI